MVMLAPPLQIDLIEFKASVARMLAKALRTKHKGDGSEASDAALALMDWPEELAVQVGAVQPAGSTVGGANVHHAGVQGGCSTGVEV